MENTSPRQSLKIVPPDKKKCIWMEAGVVSLKICYNNYDCTTCDYDLAMQQKVARLRETSASQPVAVETPADKLPASWVEKMMLLPASKRKCRYMLTGEVARKICPNAYECGNCSFDQMMQARLEVEVLPVQGLFQHAGFTLDPDFYYHEGHTWARPEYGGRIRVGLDDFAQRLLGPISGVLLPEVGQEIHQGKTGFHLRLNGNHQSVLSPMDGIITHVNQNLASRPDLIHESPFEAGWLFIVEPLKMKKNLKGLYFGEEALKFLERERDLLMEKTSPGQTLAADGGESVKEILAQLPKALRLELVKVFLRS